MASSDVKKLANDKRKAGVLSSDQESIHPRLRKRGSLSNLHDENLLIA